MCSYHHTNDNVLVVTNKDEVSAMQILFGKKVDKEWNNDNLEQKDHISFDPF